MAVWMLVTSWKLPEKYQEVTMCVRAGDGSMHREPALHALSRSSVCMCCAMPLHAPCLVDVADPATAVLNLATGTGHIRKVWSDPFHTVNCFGYL